MDRSHLGVKTVFVHQLIDYLIGHIPLAAGLCGLLAWLGGPIGALLPGPTKVMSLMGAPVDVGSTASVLCLWLALAIFLSLAQRLTQHQAWHSDDAAEARSLAIQVFGFPAGILLSLTSARLAVVAFILAGPVLLAGYLILDRWVWRRPSPVAVYVAGTIIFEGLILLIYAATQGIIQAMD